MSLKKSYTPLKIMALLAVVTAPAVLADNARLKADKRHVVDHWTPDRITSAIPRDFFMDGNGVGYLRKADGSLEAYGQSQVTQSKVPNAKPSGNNDSVAPSVSMTSPLEGDVIGESHLFSAMVTDDSSGVKSVSFVITLSNGNTQSFTPNLVANDSWETTLQGFSDGNWSWHVVAKDNAKKGGNTTISNSVNFTVDTAGTPIDPPDGGGATGHIITNEAWQSGGLVQTTAGRIYFEMPGNAKRKGPWRGYVCSGTVVTDETTGRSIIITAAHCVYDDSNKAFAKNVLFIPDQALTTGSGTDTNCDNDPLGCWTPSFGVVDVNWTTRTFPNNVEWDYAYYVVSDSGSHFGTNASDILDSAAGSLPISFQTPYYDDGDPSASSFDFTHALGYSYSEDPNFMYCAEDMTTEGVSNWWLASCGLSGGASGGPWVQSMDLNTGSGSIISVNSWGYTTNPGMAGPMLGATSAGCLFNESKWIGFDTILSADGDAGVAIDYCP